MAANKFISFVRDEVFEAPNEVVDGWAISRNPILIWFILGTYLMFVCKIGPTIMRDRKPYELNLLIQIYNLAQVVICLFLVAWVRRGISV